MLRTGEMRHTVTVQVRSETKRPSGQFEAAWTTVTTRRAAIAAQTGTEKNAPQQQVGRVVTLFTMRYLANVTPGKNRLVFDERVFDIKSAIDPDQRREKLLITAEERIGETP